MSTNTTKPDASHVVVRANGTTAAFVGRDAMSLFRAITLRQGLIMYAKHGIRPTRNATPTVMLSIASEYTGKAYKRGAYLQAAEDVRIWIETMKAAMPIIDESGKQAP